MLQVRIPSTELRGHAEACSKAKVQGMWKKAKYGRRRRRVPWSGAKRSFNAKVHIG